VLHSGATDLYLAVTLPGERAFLADPEVWSLLESHAVPLELDLEEGRFRSVRLGDDRRAVERALGASPGSAISGTLIARAGPHMIWALTFAPDGALDEILVDTDRLLRYTPTASRSTTGSTGGSPARPRRSSSVPRCEAPPPRRTSISTPGASEG